MTNKQAPLFFHTFERTLDKILECVCVSDQENYSETAEGKAFRVANSAFGQSANRIPSNISTATVSAIAVAYSGGLDSSVLLHLAHAYTSIHGIKLFAFHIHHGINEDADAWLRHCQDECARLNIAFDTRRVDISEHEKNGIEAAARICRYAALGKLCRLHRIPLLLTAHHQDDQAETVLLQMLRGAGVAGLSGMSTANTAPDLLGVSDVVMARPLLTVSRQDLAQFAKLHAIRFIEDSSNTDPRYVRNALRHSVMSLLAESFPGFQERFTRTAQHAQSAQRLLVELAIQDLAICQEGGQIDINRLRRLNNDRIDNLLRYWFGSQGLSMPSTAWLSELRTQLLEAKIDAQLCVTHQDCHIRRYRGRVFITPRFDVDTSSILPQAFRWNGERRIHFPAYNGVLYFEEVEDGIDAEWLQEQPLLIRYRQGGERLKLAYNQPTKKLKHHYQSLDIPAWERAYLPLVTTEDRLLFAAGIGMDCHQLSIRARKSVRFQWKPASFPSIDEMS